MPTLTVYVYHRESARPRGARAISSPHHVASGAALELGVPIAATDVSGRHRRTRWFPVPGRAARAQALQAAAVAARCPNRCGSARSEGRLADLVVVNGNPDDVKILLDPRESPGAQGRGGAPTGAGARASSSPRPGAAMLPRRGAPWKPTPAGDSCRLAFRSSDLRGRCPSARRVSVRGWNTAGAHTGVRVPDGDERRHLTCSGMPSA